MSLEELKREQGLGTQETEFGLGSWIFKNLESLGGLPKQGIALTCGFFFFFGQLDTARGGRSVSSNPPRFCFRSCLQVPAVSSSRLPFMTDSDGDL